MNEAVFDTSVLIDHLRGVKEATELVEKVKEGIIVGHVSTLTEAELFAGKESEDEDKRASLIELLSLFNRIAVNEDIARIAGEFRRRYGIALPDAIIAATSFLQRCRLLTMDIKDFSRVKDIKAEKPYDY